MTDVKFMDLSQNNNPANTDSVLIGNSTDGLKRTTVGAIGNLFSVKGLFHLETVTGQTNPNPAVPNSDVSVGITAPDVPGYNFAFWLSSSTTGSIAANYVSSPNAPTTTVWVVAPSGTTTPIKIRVNAVYVKSTVA